MVRKFLAVTVVSAFIILHSGDNGYAQKTSFSLNGGIADALGEGSENWNLGFSTGGNAFYHFSPNVSYGGRIAYNRWTAKEDEIRKEVTDFAFEGNVSGFTRIIEIVQSIRIIVPMNEAQTVNFFSQFGLGFYLWHSEIKVEGSYPEDFVTVYPTGTLEDSDGEIGISFGLGFTIGGGSTRFEILPLFHRISTEHESTKYFSVNIGIVLARAGGKISDIDK